MSRLRFVRMCALTDGGDEVIKPLLRKEGVLQTSEVKFENSSHRVDIMVILIICQRVIAWETRRVSVNEAILKTYRLDFLRRKKTPFLCLSVITFHYAPLSKEFLMSLTSTWEPETRNMPWCWRPVVRGRERERNIKTSEEALDMQCPIRTVERMSSAREENANFLRMDAFSNQI